MGRAANYSLWDAYAEQFKTEFRRGNLESASNTLDCALSDAEEFREVHPVLIWCVHSLSGRYCAQGDYSAATKLLRRGIEIKEKVLGSDHPDFVNNLEKLALFQLKIMDKPQLMLALSGDAHASLFPQTSQSTVPIVEVPKSEGEGRIANFISRIRSQIFSSLN